MSRSWTSGLMLVALLGAVGCQDQLVVENKNNPDTGRVLATAADLEALLSTQYTRFHGCLWGSSTSTQPQMGVMPLENYSGLANFGMGPSCLHDAFHHSRGSMGLCRCRKVAGRRAVSSRVYGERVQRPRKIQED